MSVDDPRFSHRVSFALDGSQIEVRRAVRAMLDGAGLGRVEFSLESCQRFDGDRRERLAAYARRLFTKGGQRDVFLARALEDALRLVDEVPGAGLTVSQRGAIGNSLASVSDDNFDVRSDLVVLLEFVDGRRVVGSRVHELERCALAHGDAARACDRSSNAAGAAELRRVENLLWALIRGEPWSLVLQGLAPQGRQDGLGDDDAPMEVESVEVERDGAVPASPADVDRHRAELATWVAQLRQLPDSKHAAELVRAIEAGLEVVRVDSIVDVLADDHRLVLQIWLRGHRRVPGGGGSALVQAIRWLLVASGDLRARFGASVDGAAEQDRLRASPRSSLSSQSRGTLDRILLECGQGPWADALGTTLRALDGDGSGKLDPWHLAVLRSMMTAAARTAEDRAALQALISLIDARSSSPLSAVPPEGSAAAVEIARWQLEELLLGEDSLTKVEAALALEGMDHPGRWDQARVRLAREHCVAMWRKVMGSSGSLDRVGVVVDGEARRSQIKERLRSLEDRAARYSRGLSARLSPLIYRLGRSDRPSSTVEPDMKAEYDFSGAVRGRFFRREELTEEELTLVEQAISLPTTSSVLRGALFAALVALSHRGKLAPEKRATLEEFVRYERGADSERGDCARGVDALLAVLAARARQADSIDSPDEVIAREKRALDQMVDDARARRDEDDELLERLNALSEWSRELWDAARPGAPLHFERLHEMRRLARALDDLVRSRSGVSGAKLGPRMRSALEERLGASDPVFGESGERMEALRGLLSAGRGDIEVRCARCQGTYVASGGDLDAAGAAHQSACPSTVAELERLRSMHSMLVIQAGSVALAGGVAAASYRAALSRRISEGGSDASAARELLAALDAHRPSTAPASSDAFVLVPVCAQCGGRPASCIGHYEGGDDAEDSPACDDCCGHGNEDGTCRPLQPGDWRTISP